MIFLDLNANNGLNRISSSLDTYAELLRLDPVNLVNDGLFNELIFKYQVYILFNQYKTVFSITINKSLREKIF